MKLLGRLFISLIVFNLGNCCSNFDTCSPIATQGLPFRADSIAQHLYFVHLEVRIYGEDELKDVVVDSKLCSGTLIRQNFVVTSAECFTFADGEIGREVKLVFYTQEGNEINENEILLSPARIYVHERRLTFNQLPIYGYEIAILQLPANTVAQHSVVDVELPNEAKTKSVSSDRVYLTFAGYFKARDKMQEQGTFGVMEVLLQDINLCRTSMEIRRKEWLREYDQSLLCAFARNSKGSMAIPFDIGAGLMELKPGSPPILHGVLSTPVFSRLNVQQSKEIDPDAPTYFNRVSYSKNWMNEILEPYDPPLTNGKAKQL